MDITNNVIKAMNGDQQAISELYYATYPKLHAVAVSVLKNEADADDLVQDSYIKAFSNLNQLEDAKNFEPWLCRIVSNKCKDYLKKNKPVLFSTLTTEDDNEPIEWLIEIDSKEYDPEALLISADIRKQIMDLLDSLPDEQRICLVYYVVQEMKIREIAELLEVSENTVKSRINYAKSKMKTKIDDLEKNGIKLRNFAGFALFPFIRHLFATQSASVPPIPAETVASSSSAVIGQTAKSVVGHTIKHIGLKIASGIVAAVVTITTVATVITNVGQKEPTSTDNTPTTSNESSNIILNLSGQELADLNKYLSYFAEARFSQYPCDDVSLYNFAYIYNSLHAYNNIYTDKGSVFDYSYCIEKDIIDGTIKKFFNTQISEISTDYASLKDGVYYNVAADGETHPYLSIARQLYKESDDTYRVIFDVYKVLNLYGGNPVPSYYFELDAVAADMNSSISKQSGGVAIITKDNSDDFYIKEYKVTISDNSLNEVYALYEGLLRNAETEKGLQIAYYAYINLNEDGIPELLVSDANGTPDSWSTCEIYTYKNGELHFCGETNSNYDYFYLVNNKYVLGMHRMGNQFVSIDECISTILYCWDEAMARNDPAISFNGGDWEYLTKDEFEFYQAMPDGDSSEAAFIKTAESIVLNQNHFAKKR